MVYMYLTELTFCIRNASAALVMKYGIGPVFMIREPPVTHTI